MSLSSVLSRVCSSRKSRLRNTSLGLVLCVGGLLCPTIGQAQVLQRFSVHLEGAVGGMLGGSNAAEFGVGGAGAVRLGFQIVGPFSVQLSGSGAWLPSIRGGLLGEMSAFSAGVRLGGPVAPGAWGGPLVDFNAGLVLTGGVARFGFDIGAGWEFVLGSVVRLGPMIRYIHIVQPDQEARPDDAYILVGGVSLTLHIPIPPVHKNVVAPSGPADSDGDGIEDTRDRCPLRAEDVDGFEDEDGCLDADNDQDGFLDDQDSCRGAAETPNGFEDLDGCPDTVPEPEVHAPPPEPQWRPLDVSVHFQNHRHVIPRAERAVLQQLCARLSSDLATEQLRVVGHADERGSHDFNHMLAAQRAGAVASFLSRCGVDHHRIETMSHGASQPLCQDTSQACHHQNRRVDFEVSNAPASSP